MNAKAVDFEANDDFDDNLEANTVQTNNAFVDFLERRTKSAHGIEKAKFGELLTKERLRRNASSAIFNSIAKRIVPNGFEVDINDDFSDLIEYDCYRASVEGFRLFCGEVDEHELPRLTYFIKLCKTTSKREILRQIQEACPKKLWEEEDLYV